MTPNFDRAEKAATELLLYQKTTPSGLGTFCDKLFHSKNIIVDSMQNYGTLMKDPYIIEKADDYSDAYTVMRPEVSIVLYNADQPTWTRQNFSLAHEFGHIYLNHIDQGSVEEVEANYFAAQLLMPEIVVRRIMSKAWCNTFLLSRWFNVSVEAATNRLASIYKKKSYLYRNQETRLLAMYQEPIDCYIKSNGFKEDCENEILGKDLYGKR